MRSSRLFHLTILFGALVALATVVPRKLVPNKEILSTIPEDKELSFLDESKLEKKRKNRLKSKLEDIQKDLETKPNSAQQNIQFKSRVSSAKKNWNGAWNDVATLAKPRINTGINYFRTGLNNGAGFVYRNSVGKLVNWGRNVRWPAQAPVAPVGVLPEAEAAKSGKGFLSQLSSKANGALSWISRFRP